MTPALIIFDCDGVLVDTEHITGAFLQRYLQSHGVHEPEEDALYRYRGSSLAAAIADLEERTKCKVPANFATQFRNETMATMAQGVHAIPGVASALKAIASSAITSKKCVASNGPIQKMQLTLKMAKLSHHFGDALFSAYEIKRWKPDPALFLHAANVSGVAPEDCLVIEDSLHGVDAAVAAGMPVLAFAARSQASRFADAGARSFSEMAELPDLLLSF